MAQIYAGAEQVLAYLGELELPDFLPPSSNNPSVEIDQSGLVFDFDDTDQPILARFRARFVAVGAPMRKACGRKQVHIDAADIFSLIRSLTEDVRSFISYLATQPKSTSRHQRQLFE